MKKAQVEYNSKGKNASWDANRLVREYIGIAWMTNDTIPFQNLPWDSQVRIRRVAAVISGYLDYNLKESDPFESSAMYSQISTTEKFCRNRISMCRTLNDSKRSFVKCPMNLGEWNIC